MSIWRDSSLANDHMSTPALRLLCRVSVESRDLEPFHRIEQYRGPNPQYRVSPVWKNCDFFVFFFFADLGTIRQKSA